VAEMERVLSSFESLLCFAYDLGHVMNLSYPDDGAAA
jgi:hypothetical protein